MYNRKPISSDQLLAIHANIPQVVMFDTTQKRWSPEDYDDKRFIRVFNQLPDGHLVEISMSDIEIGRPVVLQLDTGEFVRTSTVVAWTTYGHVGIRTRSREYYYI